MNYRQRAEIYLLFLVAVLIYLTYSPADTKLFWMYWATVWVFLFFGYLLDVLFCDDLSFVFDPNTDNWRRKTDPQS